MEIYAYCNMGAEIGYIKYTSSSGDPSEIDDISSQNTNIKIDKVVKMSNFLLQSYTYDDNKKQYILDYHDSNLLANFKDDKKNGGVELIFNVNEEKEISEVPFAFYNVVGIQEEDFINKLKSDYIALFKKIKKEGKKDIIGKIFLKQSDSTHSKASDSDSDSDYDYDWPIRAFERLISCVVEDKPFVLIVRDDKHKDGDFRDILRNVLSFCGSQIANKISFLYGLKTSDFSDESARKEITDLGIDKKYNFYIVRDNIQINNKENSDTTPPSSKDTGTTEINEAENHNEGDDSPINNKENSDKTSPSSKDTAPPEINKEENPNEVLCQSIKSIDIFSNAEIVFKGNCTNESEKVINLDAPLKSPICIWLDKQIQGKLQSKPETGFSDCVSSAWKALTDKYGDDIYGGDIKATLESLEAKTLDILIQGAIENHSIMDLLKKLCPSIKIDSPSSHDIVKLVKFAQDYDSQHEADQKHESLVHCSEFQKYLKNKLDKKDLNNTNDKDKLDALQKALTPPDGKGTDGNEILETINGRLNYINHDDKKGGLYAYADTVLNSFRSSRSRKPIERQLHDAAKKVNKKNKQHNASAKAQRKLNEIINLGINFSIVSILIGAMIFIGILFLRPDKMSWLLNLFGESPFVEYLLSTSRALDMSKMMGLGIRICIGICWVLAALGFWLNIADKRSNASSIKKVQMGTVTVAVTFVLYLALLVALNFMLRWLFGLQLI